MSTLVQTGIGIAPPALAGLLLGLYLLRKMQPTGELPLVMVQAKRKERMLPAEVDEVAEKEARKSRSGNVLFMPGDPKFARRHVSHDTKPQVMLYFITVCVPLSALYVILARDYDSGTQKWAFGAVGTVTGFWFRGIK